MEQASRLPEDGLDLPLAAAQALAGDVEFDRAGEAARLEGLAELEDEIDVGLGRLAAGGRRVGGEATALQRLAQRALDLGRE